MRRSEIVAPLDQVEQAAGRGDEDVRASREPRLLDDPRAAVDGGDRQGSRVGDRPELIDDLDGELARGGQHERRGTGVAVAEQLDHRDPEGERLARAGG